MITLPALSAFKGRTTHVRYMPFERRFAYGLFLIDIDIDRLGEADKASALFSVDKPNLFSFRRKDHGARIDQPLRPWAEEKFKAAQVELNGGAVRLITFARHLFYKFAPISLWFGYGPDGDLRGVIYEVNNTFGETHAYVAAVTQAREQHVSDKRLHVSPFFDVTGKYRFTLRAPEQGLGVVVESIVDGTCVHMANIKAKRQKMSTAQLLKTAITRPFASLGVSLAIHWEAFHIWRRGAGYRSRPPLAETDTTCATSTRASAEKQEYAA